MIKSMTGFGRFEYQQGEKKYTVEMKAVNHRYFDVSIRMPKKFNFFEAAIRNTLKNYVQRGKVDMFITYEDRTETNFSLNYNEHVAAEYLKYYHEMAQQFLLENDVTVSVLGKCPEVFTLEEQTVDEDEIWSALEKTVVGASEQFVESRIREGEALKTDLLEKLDHMLENVSRVEARYPDIIAQYRLKLQEKVKELLGDAQIDEGRLATEVVLFSDKICTDEETVRLRSHIESMKKELIHGGSIGRKLDFIAIAIDLKTEIEKVREQIQNIE